jgi:putative transposase
MTRLRLARITSDGCRSRAALCRGEGAMGSVSFAEVVAAVAAFDRKPKEPERHELSDAEWRLVEPMLPGRKNPTGRIPRNNRQVLNGMFYVLRTGCPWRDVPRNYGPWQTVYNRFREWRQKGVIDGIAEALLKMLEERGEIDWKLWCIDGSNVRAARCAGGAPKKGGLVKNLLTMRSVALAAVSERSSTS